MKEKKFIKVYDNILSPELVDLIEDKVLNKMDYHYLQNITHDEDLSQYSPGFANLFFSVKYNLITPQSILINQVLYKLCSHLNINLYQIFNGRAFLQIPIKKDSKSNQIHNDIDIPHWVCLYYVTDSDGDTILYEDDEKTEIQRVTPKKGRIVFFDGSIKHCSSHPSKTHRAVINWNFLGEYLTKPE